MISKKKLDEVRAFINSEAANDAFYKALTKTDWIPALIEVDGFGQPEPVKIEPTDFFGAESKAISFPNWEPSRYLARMGSTKDSIVIQALTTIPETDNIAVRADIIDAVLNFPVSETAELIRREIQWLKKQRSLYTFYPQKLFALIHAVSNEDASLAIELIDAVFKLDILEEDTFFGQSSRKKDATKFDGWLYCDQLVRLSKEFIALKSLDFLQWTVSELTRALSAIAPQPQMIAGLKDDFSWIWRQTIEESDDYHSWDGKNGLVAAIRETGVAILAQWPEKALTLIELLEKQDWLVFKRLTFFMIGMKPEQFIPKIKAYAVDREVFSSKPLRREYIGLVRAAYEFLEPAEKTTFWGFVDAEKAEDRVQWYSEFESLLTSEQKRHFQELSQHYTPNEFFKSPFTHPIISGTISPIDATELLRKDDGELIGFLSSWQGSGQFGEPDVEGLADVLGVAATIDPDRIANLLHAINGINEPTYLRIALFGLSQALQNNADFQPTAILRACLGIDFENRKIRQRSLQPGEDLDLDWTGPANNAMGCLRNAIYHGRIQLADVPFALQLIRKFIGYPNPTDEEEKERLPIEDPLTLAINTVKGMAADSLLALARWLASKEALDSYRDDIEALLSANISQTQSSLSVRAIYGSNLIALESLFPDWCTRFINDIFPDDVVRFLAAWQTYIVYSGPDLRHLPILRKFYYRYLELYKNDAPVDLWRTVANPGARLAQHFVGLTINSSWEPDEPFLVNFFDSVNSEIRSEFWRHLGRSLSTVGDRWPKQVLTRLSRIWTARRESGNISIPEAKAFGWWVKCSSFDRLWVLEEFDSALEIAKSSEMERFNDSIEAFAEDSKAYPEKTLSILSKYLQFAKNGYEAAYLEQFIKQIIMNAHQFPEQVDEAVDSLVSLGLLEFRRFSSSSGIS